MRAFHKALVVHTGVILLFAACSGDPQIQRRFVAERMFFRAGKLYQQVMVNPRIATHSDYSAAVGAYEHVLSDYPGNTNDDHIEKIKKQSLVTIAELWLLQGEIQAAIRTYDRFLGLYPDDPGLGAFVHFANARSNERIFNLDKAIAEYEILIDDFGEVEDPLQPNHNILTLPLKVARLKRSSGVPSGQPLYNEALQYYDSVIEQWPGSPAAFNAAYYKASIFADQRRWRKVITTLTTLAKEYPDREEAPNILLSLGNMYLDGLGQTREATRVFDGLLRKFPEDEISGYAHFGNARSLIKSGRAEKGRAGLNEVISSHPDNPNLCASAQLAVASSYEEEGNWERALVEYRWVQESYPLTFQGFYVPTYIAEYYRKKGEASLARTSFQEAIDHYTHLIRKYPKTMLAGTAQEYIIYCLSVQEKWEQAAEAAISLRNVHPGSRTNISSYLFLGQIYESSNNVERAIEIYEKFADEFPNHPIIGQILTKVDLLRRKV